MPSQPISGGHGFLGIEHLPNEIEQCGHGYRHHAEVLREAVAGKDPHTILSELVLVLAQLEQDRG
jgi:hypothetical protein